MITTADALTALEGALNSAIALAAFTEGENDPVSSGLLGVIAGINSAMTMLEDALDADPVEGECRHPDDRVVVRRAGRSEMKLCQACNEIVG